MEQLGVEPDGGDMENLLMEMDTDGDGRVGVTEFIKAFKKLGVEKTLEKEVKRCYALEKLPAWTSFVRACVHNAYVI